MRGEGGSFRPRGWFRVSCDRGGVRLSSSHDNLNLLFRYVRLKHW